ncbi:MAG: TrmH family RNA methyltransferase [Dissulfurispiraceae bacterium]|jgi:RNA methyltransferase, TrmH family
MPEIISRVMKIMVRKKISSAENQFVRKAVEAKNRRRGGEHYFLAEGPHMVEMAVTSSAQIEEVFFTMDFVQTAQGKKILGRLSQRMPQPMFLVEVPANILAKIADTETPQGIIAVVAQLPVPLLRITARKDPLIAVCDGIRDPGNLGTIIRVADAAGADAVLVLPGTCDPFSPKALRATAGSIFNVPVIGMGYSGLFDCLTDMNIDLIVTDINAGNSLYNCNLKRSVALALGNEARGVSEALVSMAADAVSIPIPGKAESLNVAVAAAVCLYEAVRQRTASTG